MKNRYNAVLFDLDSTLIDNSFSFVETFRRYCRKYPEVLSPDDPAQQKCLTGFFSLSDDQRRKTYRSFCAEYHWDDAPEYDDFWQDWNRIYLDSIIPKQNAYFLLDSLVSRGIRIGIVTNGGEKSQNAKITSAGLRPYPELILTSQEAGVEKPDPEIYRIALRRMDLSPSEVLFVGDTPETDIAGAVAAGIDSCLLFRRRESPDATYRVTDLSEILNLI